MRVFQLGDSGRALAVVLLGLPSRTSYRALGECVRYIFAVPNRLMNGDLK